MHLHIHTYACMFCRRRVRSTFRSTTSQTYRPSGIHIYIYILRYIDIYIYIYTYICIHFHVDLFSRLCLRRAR